MALAFKILSSLAPAARSGVIIPFKKSKFINHCLIITRGHKRHVSVVRKMMKIKKDAMDPQPPNHRSTYAEWNYNAELFAFGKRLGEEFDKNHLQRAFIERSYIIMEEEKQKKVGIEDPKISLEDNTEFVKMGEPMISNYVKRYLRTVYSRLPEEGICSICDYLLSDEVLADIAKNIGISDLILTAENPPEEKTLANVLKAVVIALEQSSGTDRANMFIRDIIITYLSGKDINEIWEINPESTLALILQNEGRSQAEPRLIGEVGKNTILSAFQVGLYCDKEFIGLGFGESVSIAKQIAAMDALKRLFQTTEHAKPIPFDLVLPSESKEPFANVSIQDWCEKNIKSLVKNPNLKT